MTHISMRMRELLIRDLAAGKADLCTLAREHDLPEEILAAWMADPETRQVLANLCAASDFQTQLMVSRYRTLAAGKLIDLAHGGESGGAGETAGGRANSEPVDPAPPDGRPVAAPPVSPEVSRKACVDLLKLELKRTADDPGGGPTAGPDDAEDAAEGEALRKMLYGKAEEKES